MVWQRKEDWVGTAIVVQDGQMRTPAPRHPALVHYASGASAPSAPTCCACTHTPGPPPGCSSAGAAESGQCSCAGNGGTRAAGAEAETCFLVFRGLAVPVLAPWIALEGGGGGIGAM